MFTWLHKTSTYIEKHIRGRNVSFTCVSIPFLSFISPSLLTRNNTLTVFSLSDGIQAAENVAGGANKTCQRRITSLLNSSLHRISLSSLHPTSHLLCAYMFSAHSVQAVLVVAEQCLQSLQIDCHDIDFSQRSNSLGTWGKKLFLEAWLV